MNIDTGFLTIPESKGQQTYSHNCEKPKIVLLFGIRDDYGSNNLLDHFSLGVYAFDGRHGGSTTVKFDKGYSSGMAFGSQMSSFYQYLQLAEGSGFFVYWGLGSDTKLNPHDFRLTWKAVDTSYSNTRIFWIVVGGDDVDAKVVMAENPSSPRVQDYTDVGFQGNALQAFWQRGPLNTAAGIVSWGWGMAVEKGNEASFHVISDFGPQTDTARNYHSDSFIRMDNPSGVPLVAANFDAWLENGFQLKYTDTATSGNAIMMIVWKVPDAAIKTVTQPMTTGIEQIANASGNLPRLMFLTGSGQTEPGHDTEASAISYGAFTNPSDVPQKQFSLSGGMNQDQPSTVHSVAEDVCCLKILDENSAFNVKCAAKITAADENYINFDWTDVSTESLKFCCLLLGEKVSLSIPERVQKLEEDVALLKEYHS
jgi:hypothetical protein